MSDYADIQPELDVFENAVYGEEVRSSMISAIKKIHDVAESAAGAPDASSATAGQAPVADGAGGWQWGDVATSGDSVPTNVRQALFTLLNNAVYRDTDLQDEKAIIQSWATEVTSITLNRTSLSFGSVQVVILQATTVPSSVSVVWTTSDASVATVDNGVVTPVGNGTCTITATAGDLSATCAVSVSAFASLVSISAVYSGGTVYTNDTLNSLKSNLVVTATYSDSSTAVIAGSAYTLSGTLAEGTQTITVAYSGKTTTFNVTCVVDGWLYHFNGSLASSGSKDFELEGSPVYGSGRNDNQAYYHIIPTSGDTSSDTQLGLKAIDLAEYPNLSGDFTIAYWFASQVQGYQHPLYLTKTINTSVPSNNLISDITISSPWSGTITDRNSNTTAGVGVQGTAGGLLVIRLTNESYNKSNQIRLTIPDGFDTTEWHHYAITKTGTTLRLFIDGDVIVEATLADASIYKANQISVLAMFKQTVAEATALNQIQNGGKMQDLCILEYCKWTSAFNPEAIAY